MSAGPNKNLGRTALLSGAVVGWNAYDIATTSEAPSQAVMILQYSLLALALAGLAGSLAMLAVGKPQA